MELTDKQYDGHLIDMYEMLRRIKKIADKGNAVETAEAINHEMALIELKLKPTKLPDFLKQ